MKAQILYGAFQMRVQRGLDVNSVYICVLIILSEGKLVLFFCFLELFSMIEF